MNNNNNNNTEVAHYVVTAHPPGAVLLTAKCNFTAPDSTDVIVAKSRRLEIRQLQTQENDSPFPIVCTIPIWGRLTLLQVIKVPMSRTSYLFCTTDRLKYAVLGYDEKEPFKIKTHASGSFQATSQAILGREAECAPLVSVDPHYRCIALHLYDGLLTILPINLGYDANSAAATTQKRKFAPSSRALLLGEAHHARIEERTVLDIAFVHTTGEWPVISVLHQDSRCHQHVVSHVLNLKKRKLLLQGQQHGSTSTIQKSRVDGGSAQLVAVPPPPTVAAAVATSGGSTTANTTTTSGGGILVLGQRQITYLGQSVVKVVPMQPCMLLAFCEIQPFRYLLGDEFGNLMLLVVQQSNGITTGLTLDVLGTTAICSSLLYIQDGLVFVASQFGDSQLVQIHDQEEEEEEEESLLSIVEEYTHLGPIVDFDLVPTSSSQKQVVTASGSSFSGSVRLVRNGIGMNEYASVEIPGIQNMWSLRKHYSETEDAYLVQSFVGETRVLGVSIENDVVMEEDDEGAAGAAAGGTLEEVVLSGLDSSASSLFVGNVQEDNSLLQITESQIRLIHASTFECVDTWGDGRLITVASATESGQIVVALRGGRLLYLQVEGGKIVLQNEVKMAQEISCIDLNPLVSADDMDTETAPKSTLVAVGLWVDFTVRLLSLENNLDQVLEINLSNVLQDQDTEEPNANALTRTNRSNMMARSLCLMTLDSSSSSGASSTNGVNMLFVGLGDGTLVSFAVVQQDNTVTVRSKKEVSLGTQRINLVPLKTERGGTCVLATGDRPTVIYLAGGGGGGANGVNFSNPKLCYSNVNLSTSDVESDDVSRPPAQQSIAVNVATPFRSSLLFDTTSSTSTHYSLCVSDDVNLRLGVIDDIQKLHVTTCCLGMAPRRIVHCAEGRLFAVGCIESGIQQGGRVESDVNMGNCVRFLDDTTFDDIHRIDLEPYEMVLSMLSANLSSTESSAGRADEPSTPGRGGEASSFTTTKPYLLVGTAYALPDEEEPTRGRILVFSCSSDGVDGGKSAVRQVTELPVHGGVYSMCQFYDGKVLVSVNSKTQICQLDDDGSGTPKLETAGVGHHGHILSLFVKSRANLDTDTRGRDTVDSNPLPVLHETPIKQKSQSENDEREQLAIVGDLMRSISLVQYYPQHDTLEEIARDFNANWTTAIEMLTDHVYLGAENWNNLFVLRRNAKAQSEEVRCRLDTVGEFHLGEMVNKFMGGSLVMPHSSSSGSARRGIALRPASTPVKGNDGNKKPSAAARTRRPTVNIGSQTLFGTVDGSLGSVIGLDMRTAVFFAALERAMERTIPAVGDFGHAEFRAFDAEQRVHPSHGFVDGDLVESFLDLDRATMEAVVKEMNVDGGWEIEDHGVTSGGSREDQEGVSGSGRGSALSDDEEDEDKANNGGVVLTVEDVLAMVEEMTMLH